MKPIPFTPNPHARASALGLLLIVEAVLSLAPVIILGQAIGWPASLSKPAAQQLASIAAVPDAVALGYGLYLLYSVLIAPVMIGLAARAFGSLAHPVAAAVAAFATLSVLARTIGITRWLTVMPVLSLAHSAADAASQAQIEIVFRALNAYGGGIGEIIGVGLMMAIAMLTLSIGALRIGSMPKWLSLSGVLIAVLLALLVLPALRIAVTIPVAIPVTALTAWMLAAAVWCLRKPSLATP